MWKNMFIKLPRQPTSYCETKSKKISSLKQPTIYGFRKYIQLNKIEYNIQQIISNTSL